MLMSVCLDHVKVRIGPFSSKKENEEERRIHTAKTSEHR